LTGQARAIPAAAPRGTKAPDVRTSRRPAARHLPEPRDAPDPSGRPQRDRTWVPHAAASRRRTRDGRLF